MCILRRSYRTVATILSDIFQPVGTPAAGGHHGVLGVDLHVHLAVGHGNALADVIFQNQVAALVAKVHLYAVLL